MSDDKTEPPFLLWSRPSPDNWVKRAFLEGENRSHNEFKNLYLGEFPPPPKVGDGATWKGRNVIIREIEPGGDRGRATVQEVETGRERNVSLSTLIPIDAP